MRGISVLVGSLKKLSVTFKGVKLVCQAIRPVKKPSVKKLNLVVAGGVWNLKLDKIIAPLLAKVKKKKVRYLGIIRDQER